MLCPFSTPCQIITPLLKSLYDCLILTPPPHLTLNLPILGGVIIWQGSELGTTLTRHLHRNGRAFDREMHQRRFVIYFNWFSSFLQIYFLCLWAGSLLWRTPFTETAWDDRKHIQKWREYFKLFPQKKKKDCADAPNNTPTLLINIWNAPIERFYYSYKIIIIIIITTCFGHIYY